MIRPQVWKMLLSALAIGCSTVEPPPRVTQAEYDEVRRHFFSSKNGAAHDDYFSSERGKALATKRLRQFFGDRGISILRGATRVETFRIVDTAGLDDGPGPYRKVRSNLGGIDGYTITARGEDQGRGFAERLSAYLLQGKHFFITLDCMPDPGVAFRAWREKESVSLVICYECDYLKVFVHDERGSTVHRGGSYFVNEFVEPKLMTELAKEAFPDDKEIQSMPDS